LTVKNLQLYFYERKKYATETGKKYSTAPNSGGTRPALSDTYTMDVNLHTVGLKYKSGKFELRDGKRVSIRNAEAGLKKMNTQEPQNLSRVLIPKTCSRCGGAFGATGREYACAYCKQSSANPEASVPPKLSFREKQIVSLIQQAKSNKEIAYELCLTIGTVKEYIYHIFRKLGVSNRTELALWGRDRQDIELAS